MTAAVYIGPRCPDHPGARCIEARCVECGNRVGNPVTACTDCGYTSCPGRCGLPPLDEDVTLNERGSGRKSEALSPLPERIVEGAPTGPRSLSVTSTGPAPTSVEPRRSGSGRAGGASTTFSGPRPDATCLPPGSRERNGVNRGPLEPPTTVQVSEPPTTGAGGGSLICTTNQGGPR